MKLQGKRYCSRRDDFGCLCYRKAIFYIEKPTGKRKALYARCEACARFDAAVFALAMPKEPTA